VFDGVSGACGIGSVKANIGHTMTAAGIAGLLKVILALRHRQLPPQPNFRSVNPKIDLSAGPLFVVTRAMPWKPGSSGVRVGAVSSFGFSGTNAHVVLEEAPEPEPAAPGPDRPWHLLSLSAKSAGALGRLAGRYAGHLREHAEADLGDVCATAATGRSHFPHRLAVVAGTAADAREELAAFAAGRESRWLAGAVGQPRIVFLFGGQEGRYPGMGRELYDTQPVFRQALERCAGLLDPQWGRSLLEALFPAGEGSRPEEAACIGPALFALEVALAEVWKSWGIRPVAVLGHGVGEIAADCVTGALSLADGLRLAAVRERPTGRPARLAADIESLHREGVDVFVEIGPPDCLPAGSGVRLPSLRREVSDWRQMLESLAALYVRGAQVEWPGLDQGLRRRRVTLPTYPFERRRYWTEGRTALPASGSAEAAPRGARRPSGHPLLGDRLALAAAEETRFESALGPGRPGFLAHHRVFGTAVLPAAAYLEMGLAAAARALGSALPALGRVVIRQALLLPEGEMKTVQVVVAPGGGSFQVFSLESQGESEPSWTLHAGGEILAQAGGAPPPAVLGELRARCPEEVPAATFYHEARRRGLEYGPGFQALEQVFRGEAEALGRIVLPPAAAPGVETFHLHPVLLDACLQLLGAARPGGDGEDLWLPVGIAGLEVYRRSGARLWGWARLTGPAASAEVSGAEVGLFDESGAAVAKVVGLSYRRAPRAALLGQEPPPEDPRSWLYDFEWRPAARELPPAPVAAPGPWLVFADRGGLGRRLAQWLRDGGDSCVVVAADGGEAAAGAEEIRLDSGDPQELRRLLQRRRGEPPWRGAVHLWSLDAGAEEDGGLAALEEAHRLVCGSVLHLVQALAAAEVPPRLWLVTRGARPVGGAPPRLGQAPLGGLARVIFLEHPGLRPVEVDLDPAAGVGEAELELLRRELAAGDRESLVAYRGGVRHVARLRRRSVGEGRLSVPEGPSRLTMASYGVLEDLRLGSLQRRSPGPGEVEIAVRASGLNLRDVLHALGMLREHAERLGITSAAAMPFGFECAGEISAVGEGVAGLAAGDAVAALAVGGLSSFVTVPVAMVVKKPAAMSFEAAAGLPMAWLTAFYGLCRLAGLKAGDRVLIHAAAGGVGQAAVRLARRVGAQVFATASAGKWGFLRAMGVEHVMSSRDKGFAAEVLERTGGRGVDVVLNSLAGELIDESVAALAPQGRFVELGKIGIWDEAQVRRVKPGASYFPFDLGEVARANPELISEMLATIVAGLEEGSLEPLPLETFEIAEAVAAFRHMAQARHIGKVVLTRRERGGPRVRSDGTYLITGGLGALGLHVAGWLVEQGARHLVLAGRRGLGEAAAQRVRGLEQAGARVEVVAADVSRRSEVEGLLSAAAQRLPPLAGVVHAAGVLDDGVLSQQSWPRFAKVLAPKVGGAWHLHELTRELPLDFFLCFSSVASLLGSPGQGNYAAANAFLDALAHHRRAAGLPALTVNWGPWAGGGMAAGLGEAERRRLAAQGLDSLAPEQALAALGELLAENATQAGVLRMDWPKLLRSFPKGGEPPLLEAFAPGLPPAPPFLQELKQAPPGDRLALLAAYARTQVTRVLGMSPEDPIAPRQPLIDLGVDSLMALELRNRLEAGLGLSLRATLLFDFPTLEALVAHLAEKVIGGEPGGGPAAATPGEDAGGALAGVNDELDDLLREIGEMPESEVRSRLATGTGSEG
jgi:myxalamid-type polyketide synthase MxaB